MRAVKVYWMRGKGRTNPSLKNFGDWLSKDVFEYVSGKKVIWENAKKAEYFGIGSIGIRINKLPFFRLCPLKIWGSGLSSSITPKRHRCIKLISCRGELSKNAFSSATTIPHNLALGDPGLFASEIWKPNKNKRKLAVILNEGELGFRKHIPKNMDFISPLGEPQEVIHKLSGYDFIISSSLHGLIIADAYNIPSRMLKIKLNKFKFEDYYSAFVDRRMKEPLDLKQIQNINIMHLEQHFAEPEFNLMSIKEKLSRTLLDSLG